MTVVETWEPRALEDWSFDGLPFGELVRPVVQLGISSGAAGQVAGLWDRAKWDNRSSGRWSGTEPYWYDLDPCWLRSVSITRGRNNWLERFGSGACQVSVDDSEGLLTWGADTPSNQLALRPGRHLRVLAFHVPSGRTYPLWRGFVEKISSTMVPDLPPTVTLDGHDGLDQLAHVDLPEQTPVGAGELSNERIARLLLLADWPTQWQKLDVGVVRVQATNLARPVLDDVGITADSEGGAFYAQPDGVLRFRNRDWLRRDPVATTVQAIIGTGPGQQCAADYKITRDGTDIVNDVSVAIAGGTANRFTDEASIAWFRRRTWSRTDFISQQQSDADLIGRRVLNTRSYAQARLPEMTFRPLTAADFAFCLAVDFGWLLDVRYVPGSGRMTGGKEWSRLMHVQGVRHAFGPAGWETIVNVDDSYASPASGWDDPRTGAGWDYSKWSEPL